MSLVAAPTAAPGDPARELTVGELTAGELVAGLGGVHTALDRVPTVDPQRPPAAGPGQAARAIREVDRAIARLQALRLALVAAADRDQVARDAGLSGTGAWLAAHTRAGGAAASADVRLAAALAQDLPATRAALQAGQLSTEHAAVIAAATTQLPAALGGPDRAAVEAALVAQARLLDPPRLRRAARRALAAAGRSQDEVDAHQDQVLRTEEDRALARTRLSLHDNLDGTTTGHFTVPTLAAAILTKTIQQLTSPRRTATRAARHAATTTTGPRRPARDDAPIDWAHRYGQAFTELLEHLPTDRLTGKVAATIVVTIDADRLKNQLGAAHLDTGHDVSAATTRRLACNAGLLPAVLAGTSLPLDLGRTQRFFTEAQRVALATTYDTCAATGCDRPYAWTELHHHHPWATGGTTNLHHAIPLCGHHHRRIHDPSYHHDIETNHHVKHVTFTRRT
jgi:hypothetical protein